MLDNKNIKLTSSAINSKNYKLHSNNNNNNNNNNNKSMFKRSYHKKSKSSSIKPLKGGIFDSEACNLISTMDIETISLNNKQIPIAISTTYNSFNLSICSKLFLIDYDLLSVDPVRAVNNL
jgi:sortase (surface protein transpeptidase)